MDNKEKLKMLELDASNKLQKFNQAQEKLAQEGTNTQGFIDKKYWDNLYARYGEYTKAFIEYHKEAEKFLKK
jgi:hypothetical protein